MLFENYNRGIVLMKNKSKTPAELNYDCGNQVMMFKSGAEEMILTNLSQVDTVYIGDSKFIPAGKRESFSAKNRHKAQRKAKFYINKCRSASCMQSGWKRTPA